MRDLREGEILVGQLTVRVARDAEGDLFYSFRSYAVRDGAEMAGGLLDLFFDIALQQPDLPFHASHICDSHELMDEALRRASDEAREVFVASKERAHDDITTCSVCQLTYSDRGKRDA